MGIESMREEELRDEILAWKTKYTEIEERIKLNNEKNEDKINLSTNKHLIL